MPELSLEKTRQLIKACTYYYIEELGQQEIAEKMGVSRSQVSRMLTQAKAAGIVNITIKNPFSEEQKYERWLTQRFNLLDAIVIDAPETAPYEFGRRAAQAMTELLSAALKDNTTFGVMAGTAINSISENIGPIDRKGLQVIPLVGGVGSQGNWQANLNARNFGEKFNAKYMSLNAPHVVNSLELRNALVNEPEIADVLAQGRKSTTALVGIGQVSSSATIFGTNVFSQAEMGELLEKGAVASICSSFLDANGNVIDFSACPRMIGMTVEEMKQIPKVIGIAWSQEKVPAIAATLRGHWVDILVTSLATAKAIQEYCT